MRGFIMIRRRLAIVQTTVFALKHPQLPLHCYSAHVTRWNGFERPTLSWRRLNRRWPRRLEARLFKLQGRAQFFSPNHNWRASKMSPLELADCLSSYMVSRSRSVLAHSRPVREWSSHTPLSTIFT
jgi:hypothetical protein